MSRPLSSTSFWNWTVIQEGSWPTCTWQELFMFPSRIKPGAGAFSLWEDAWTPAIRKTSNSESDEDESKEIFFAHPEREESKQQRAKTTVKNLITTGIPSSGKSARTAWPGT